MKQNTHKTNTPNSAKCLVCAECMDDDYLKILVDSSKHNNECHWCHQNSRVVDIREIANCFEKFFKIHFTKITNELDCNEGDSGELVNDIIMHYAGVKEILANKIRKELEEKYSNSNSENPFSKHAKYRFKKESTVTRSKKWQELQKTIQYQNRSLNNKTRKNLNSTIGRVLRKYPESDIFLEIGPEAIAQKGANQLEVFRARVFETRKSLVEALAHPDKELGPPPPEKAKSGRLNANGISVIYCATSVETAIAEVRPPVGSLVAVASFKVNGQFRLLDIEALKDFYKEVSILNPEYIKRKSDIKFFEELCDNISAPVTPSNEQFEYPVTQIIADYLSDFDIDGIIYNSSQIGAIDEIKKVRIKKNMMIFHKSSKINMRSVLEERNVRAPDDEKSPKYLVYEKKSESESEEKVTSPSLTLDTDKLFIHKVNRVKYKRSKTKVEFHEDNSDNEEDNNKL